MLTGWRPNQFREVNSILLFKVHTCDILGKAKILEHTKEIVPGQGLNLQSHVQNLSSEAGELLLLIRNCLILR